MLFSLHLWYNTTIMDISLPSFRRNTKKPQKIKYSSIREKLSKTFDFVALKRSGKRASGSVEVVNLLSKNTRDTRRQRIVVTFGSVISLLSRIKKVVSQWLFWGRGKFYRVAVLGAFIVFAVVFFIPYASGEAAVIQGATVKGEELYFSFSGDALASDVLYDYGSGKTVIPADRPDFRIRRYTVQAGDKLSTIAQKFEVSVDTIKWSNGLTSDFIRPGQVLEIPPIDGVIHTVERGDTLSSLVKKYHLGEKGMNEQTIVDWNIFLEEPYTLEVGMKLIIPGGEIEPPKPPSPIVAATPTYGKAPSGIIAPNQPGLFIRPVPPGYGMLSQTFHAGHSAIDICDRRAPDIIAAASGKVIFSGWWKGGGGNSVWIDHGNGYITYYAHMAVLYVKVGDQVVQGQPIGKMGSTGRATGIHLHFAIHYKGVPQNPLKYFSV